MIKLILGDCLEKMGSIPDGSVDMILCDLPYGTTQNKWDSVIPFESLWEHYNRITKDTAAIVLFGAEPFSSLLRCSNLKAYKYDWIWQKDKATGHLNAKKMPMRTTERISVFYKKQCLYKPQITDKDPKNIRPATIKRSNTGCYGDMSKNSERGIPNDKSYPKDILQFRGCFGDKGLSNHPTEKPVALLEYLIKTYTNEGEIVLDNCMGSGSTIVAAINTNRNAIGIEMDEGYFNIAQARINAALEGKNANK